MHKLTQTVSTKSPVPFSVKEKKIIDHGKKCCYLPLYEYIGVGIGDKRGQSPPPGLLNFLILTIKSGKMLFCLIYKIS